MPLIERIKLLLEITAPSVFTYMPEGGIIMGGAANANLTRFIVVPARICLQFSIGEIVYDLRGRRYKIEGISVIKGSTFYTVLSPNGQRVKVPSNMLMSAQCQPKPIDCTPITNDAEILRQEALEMIERLEEELENL